MDFLDSISVANWFIDTAKTKGQRITAMKLQKLVYFAHGWYLALYDKPLVNERVEAWRWGPVFRDIYDAAKKYGSEPIDSHIESLFGGDCPIQQGDERIPFLVRIWETYGNYSASQLSRMTHEVGGPWDTTWSKDPGRRSMDIDDDTIKDFYKRKIPTSN
ncbi:MAG: type II toxin-antitoxin system antitoxin SocA domain-containing protein [Synechococcaceae cyanobacterium ELA445]